MTYIAVRDRALEIVDKGSRGDIYSRTCDLFLSLLIIFNLICVSLESVDSLGDRYGVFFQSVEIISLILFTIEYLVRVWTAASKYDVAGNAISRRLRYIFSFTGAVDLISILPGLLQVVGVSLDLRWVRILRLLRLLKISHYSSAFSDVYSVISEERNSLLATLYLLFVAMFFSSAALYLAEGRAQPDDFASIPDAMWWSLITLTTVGYGDVSPVTPIGKIIGSFTAIIGVLTVALMTGIVSSSFANRMALKKTMLDKEIEESLEDGIISAEELRKIQSLAAELKMSDEQVEALITYERMRRSHRLKNT
jgi:voltage-gated potassium channel